MKYGCTKDELSGEREATPLSQYNMGKILLYGGRRGYADQMDERLVERRNWQEIRAYRYCEQDVEPNREALRDVLRNAEIEAFMKWRRWRKRSSVM